MLFIIQMYALDCHPEIDARSSSLTAHSELFHVPLFSLFPPLYRAPTRTNKQQRMNEFF